MYSKNLPICTVLINEFIVSVSIKNATSQLEQMDGSLIKCLCRKCDNLKFFRPNEVTLHRFRKGFTANYFNKTCHGETMWHGKQQFGVNQLSKQTNWWNQGFRKFEDPGPNSVPHWGFDDVGNYD